MEDTLSDREMSGLNIIVRSINTISRMTEPCLELE